MHGTTVTKKRQEII